MGPTSCRWHRSRPSFHPRVSSGWLPIAAICATAALLATLTGLAAAGEPPPPVLDASSFRVQSFETVLSSSASACDPGIASTNWRLVNGVNVPTLLIGDVVQAHVTSSDYTGNHLRTDYNWFVYPDEGYRGLLASPGNFVTGENVEQGRIECEWEITRDAVYPGGLPSWAWPTQGDRVLVVGSHILDCGHPTTGGTYRAEIHPPRLLVTYRNAAAMQVLQNGFPVGRYGQGSWFRFPANQSRPTRATRADIFASSYGGYAVKNVFTDTGTNLSELYPATSGPNFNPQVWWQPVNDRDYVFDVMAPPRPAPGTLLTFHIEDHALPPGAVGPQLELSMLPNGDGLRVRIPFSSVGDALLMMVAKTLYVGWEGSEEQQPTLIWPELRKVRVTLQNLYVIDDLDGIFSGAGEWGMYGYVNELGASLLAGTETNSIGETYRSMDTGSSTNAFLRSTYDVSLLMDQPLHLQFRGVENDVLTVDEAGTAEAFLGGPSSGDYTGTFVTRSAGFSLAGGEPIDDFCPGGCFDITYHVSPAPELLDAPGGGSGPGLFLRITNSPRRTGVVGIRVQLARAGRFAVDVFDPSGRRVRSLADRSVEPGAHETTWDGRDAFGREVPGGLYLVRVVTEREGAAYSKVIQLR